MARLSEQVAAVEAVLDKTQSSSDAVKLAALSRIPAPTQGAADRLWGYLIFSLSAVLLVALIALAAAVMVDKESDKFLTVISAVLAGLIGLFAPSPLGNNTGSGGNAPTP